MINFIIPAQSIISTLTYVFWFKKKADDDLKLSEIVVLDAGEDQYINTKVILDARQNWHARKTEMARKLDNIH